MMDTSATHDAGLRAVPPSGTDIPVPGSAEERRCFAQIQERLAPLFQRAFPDPHAHQTVVVIPSLSLDVEELAKISGAHHYEERMLCLLMLLRLPRTHLIYVTSQPVAATIIDYYLHLLPGVPVTTMRTSSSSSLFATLGCGFDTNQNPSCYINRIADHFHEHAHLT